MGYLSNNSGIVAKIQGEFTPINVPTEGDSTGSSEKKAFYPYRRTAEGRCIGLNISFNGELIDAKIYQGILANLEIVWRHAPELRAQLPSFFGILKNSEGIIRAAVAEDVSGYGAYEVVDYSKFTRANVPDALVRIFQDSIGELEHALVYTNGQRRIVDLDHLHVSQDYETEWQGIYDGIDMTQHTVTFTRTPIGDIIEGETNIKFAKLVQKMLQVGLRTHDELFEASRVHECATVFNMQIINTLALHGYLRVTAVDVPNPCRLKSAFYAF